MFLQLGVGSYIAHYFSTVVNSILVNFGLSEEMHYPVSHILLVFILFLIITVKMCRHYFLYGYIVKLAF